MDRIAGCDVCRIGGAQCLKRVAAKQRVHADAHGCRRSEFAQTQHGDAVFDPAAVCVDEKTLIGSYSASVDLQQESVDLVMGKEIDLERLISHRFPLAQAVEALRLAVNPQPDSMKIVIQPGGERQQ
jgi:L-iditol 2-dehydrogenase